MTPDMAQPPDARGGPWRRHHRAHPSLVEEIGDLFIRVLSAARIRAYSAAAGRERRKFSGCQSQLGCAGFRG